MFDSNTKEAETKMNRRRHWIFWINCVAEIFLLLALIFHESHTADGFGAGPEGTSRISKKVSYDTQIG